MTTAATRRVEYVSDPVLYLAFELGESAWKLGFTTGLGQAPRVRTIRSGAGSVLLSEVASAKERFGLPQSARVVSCYEAGRDGFWLHRLLARECVENYVVDSASIEVNRRRRRAKSDGLDVGKLLTMLVRYKGGERRVWHVVRVPTEGEEDRRQLHRELESVRGDRTRVTNRIGGLLATQGIRARPGKDFPVLLDRVRLWDGTPLPGALKARLVREWEEVELLGRRIKELQAERRELLRQSTERSVEIARKLIRLRGIGENSAWLYAMEFFSWRAFRNRREVGALAGLTPTPYQSGASDHEQGISKAGNRHVRWMAVEIAWGWLRFQPGSELSKWYARRFGHGSKRLRRIGIVALARKLLIALWRYLETGVAPAGAVLAD